MYRVESEILERLEVLVKRRLDLIKNCEGLYLSPEGKVQAELLDDEIKWLEQHYTGVFGKGMQEG